MKLAPRPQPRKIDAEKLPELPPLPPLPPEDPEVLTLRAAEKIFDAARVLAPRMGVDFRTAVRRMIGNTEWRHDEGRQKDAEAKRERKRAKIRAQRSSTPNDCPTCTGLGYCRCEIASNE